MSIPRRPLRLAAGEGIEAGAGRISGGQERGLCYEVASPQVVPLSEPSIR